MSYLDAVRAELASLRERDLLRVPRRALPAGAIDFSSNDYLGLRRDPRVVAALRSATVAGSGGSRLLGGASPAFGDLEAELAAWTGREAALLFSSGYLAMLGTVATLARFFTLAHSDALVHACAIDALRLAKCERRIYPHATLPLRHADDPPALVVTESRFGMDGTRADLAAHVAALGAADAIVVDEAHALGLEGPRGSGFAAAIDDERTIVVGTLSKALGVAGGFAAGPAEAIALLATAARGFVFDTAPPPALAATARAALAIVRSSEGDALRVRLAETSRRIRAELDLRGIATLPGDGPVVALPIGEAGTALRIASALEARGIFAPAIRPPTVPAGTARIRITLRADHRDADLERLVDACGAAFATATA